MQRRSGITLIEVLVTIFIMGIGMLALLTLFPLGAVSMAQALRDDRTASAATIAENIALAFDIRHDPLVVGNGTTIPNSFIAPTGLTALPAGSTGPSYPVYTDPWGIAGGGGVVTGANGTGIPRTNLFFGGAGGGAQRWCTLQDDITFLQTGTADLSTSLIQRAGWYTWAYMLQRPNAGSDAVVNLSIVVYQKRPLGLVPNEYPYLATGTAGTTGVTLTWTGTQPQPAIRRNSWLLDMSNITTGVPHGDFYRVINVTEIGGTPPQVMVEVEKPLKYGTDAMTVMQDVVDVFDKGPSWQP